MGDTGRSVERKRSDPYSAGTTLGYQYIVLDVGGKIYTSPLPSSLQLQSGKQSELAISFIPTEDVLISKSKEKSIVGRWKYRQSGSEVFHNYVDVSKLVFDDSKVYKVLSAGQQVAEICKEYLSDACIFLHRQLSFIR